MEGYDLLPKLKNLTTPTLVIAGDHDFIPADIAVHIADAIPNARLVTIKDCGDFAYLECAGEVRRAFQRFLSLSGLFCKVLDLGRAVGRLVRECYFARETAMP